MGVISLTFEQYTENYIKTGELFKHNQTPNTYFIQNELDYKPDYGSLPYNGEKYMYQFLFYDFSNDSQLRQTFFQFITNDEILLFYEQNQCMVLSNRTPKNYECEDENFYCDLGYPNDSDDLGGCLNCAVLHFG